VRIQKRQRVGEAVLTKDAGDAQKRHATAHLDHLRADAVRRLDHLGIEALRKQPLLALFAVVPRRDAVEALGRQIKRLIPRDALERVLTALQVLCIYFSALRIAGEASARPFQPALAHQRVLAATVTIEAANQRQALLTAARIPAMRGLGPRLVDRFAVPERRPDADHRAAAHIRTQDAVMRVVRRAGKCERRVVRIEIAIDALPASVGIGAQRVLDRHGL